MAREFKEEWCGCTVYGDRDTEGDWWWRVEGPTGEILAECDEPATSEAQARREAHKAAEDNDCEGW